MLGDADIFSSFAVNDVERARQFYSETLGLDVVKVELGTDVPSGLEIHLDDKARILLYPKDNHVPAEYTVLNFRVANIDRAVDELSSRGVEFEHYDTPPRTDEKGIHRSPQVRPVAWFRDPAGNILSVIQT